ncbi:hypothetical protein Pla111_12170 [Botrimarina hoheduenensis]|uniref:Uncharacterized protein n=1 Tax=Botrimarina hoheduenensis TaxID=2528000 RepID=A0A5C5WD62_9BACT|nr:hypothetical protein Pla111_12170 [Botrimarina hoheduenensis]
MLPHPRRLIGAGNQLGGVYHGGFIGPLCRPIAGANLVTPESIILPGWHRLAPSGIALEGLPILWRIAAAMS